MSDAFERVVQRERDAARGRRYARARRCLRVHAWAFVAVNLALFVAWATESLVSSEPTPAWFLPVLTGWGVGLFVHHLAVRRAWPRSGEGT